MTTIHFSTTGELLHILDDYPEVLAELRRKLLTDDLLAMPESVRAIRETQREMQETQQRIADLLNQTAERLDALEARQAQYDARLVRIEAKQDQSDARLERIEIRQEQSDTRLERMEAKQDSMEATQTEMLEWQANADKRFDRIEASQYRMEATQAEMLQWQANADKRFDHIEGELGNLRGESLERRAISRFGRIALSEFGVKRLQVIQGAAHHPRVIPVQIVDMYETRLAAAADNGLITDAEEVELREADIVARGYSRQDMSPVWFVAEVSGTIAFDDIRRAHERADILSRALSETVIPVAYGLRVSDRLRIVADARGVRIAMRPQPDENYT